MFKIYASYTVKIIVHPVNTWYFFVFASLDVEAGLSFFADKIGVFLRTTKPESSIFDFFGIFWLVVSSLYP